MNSIVTEINQHLICNRNVMSWVWAPEQIGLPIDNYETDNVGNKKTCFYAVSNGSTKSNCINYRLYVSPYSNYNDLFDLIRFSCNYIVFDNNEI